MSIDVTSEPGLKRHRVRVVMATMLATLVSVIGFAAPSRAADDVNVNNLVLIKSDVNGNTSNALPIRLGDVVKLTFDWDGSNANLKANDAFVINLPSVFDNLEHPQSRDLKVDRNGEEVTIGKCDLTQKNITCVFNNKVEELQQQGFSGFKGSVSALLSVKETRAEATAPITVNGKVVDVAIPGGKIEGRASANYNPNTFQKQAGVLNAKSKEVYWEFNFNSDLVAKALADAGNPITVDGKTVSTISFTDKLGPGQTVVNDPSRVRFMLRNSASEPNLPDSGVIITDLAGKKYSDKYGDFSLTVEDKGDTKVYKITGPFAPQTNYRLYYWATPNTDNGLVQPGFKYANEISLDGSDRSVSFQRYYSDSFTVDVKMDAGFGTFAITKLLAGPEAGNVAEGTQFTTKVKYTLPGGATTDAYKGWQAPGTVNADKTGGEVDFVVTAGKKTNFAAATFPVGTIIELSENPGTASPAANVVWGQPEFKVGNSTTNTLTIKDQTITPVELTNVAAEQPTGTFSVVKNVRGADVANKEFTFHYTCSDNQSGRITVKGDGAPVEVDKRFPVGTKCMVSEDVALAQVKGYTLTPPPVQETAIQGSDVVVPVLFVNQYTEEPKHTFSVAKHVRGADVADKEFTFNYTCNDGQSGQIKAKGDGTPVEADKRFAVGTECTVSEDEASAAVDGYTLTPPAVQKTTIQESELLLPVLFTNEYAPRNNTFSISKTGSGADVANKEFTFNYTCNDGQSGQVKVKGDGAPVGVGKQFRVGTECTVSEDQASAEVEGYELTPAAPQQINVQGGPSPELKFVNEYAPQSNTFSISKTGSGADVANKEFTFNYTCNDGQSGQVKVKGDGAPVGVGKQFRVGTECTVSEDQASAEVEGYELTPAAPQQITLKGGPSSELKFVNEYKQKPTPSPSTEPSTAPSTTAPSTQPSTEPSTEPSTTAPSTEPSTEPSTTAPSTQPSTTAPSTAPSTTAPSTQPSTTAPNTQPSTTAPSTAPSTQPSTTAPSTEPSTVEPPVVPPTKPSTDPGTVAPSTDPSTSPSATKPKVDRPTTTGSPTPQVNSTTQPRSGGPLPNTGASVLALGGLAVIALLAGAVLVVRRRNA